jgi:thioredoxin-related protein
MSKIELTVNFTFFLWFGLFCLFLMGVTECLSEENIENIVSRDFGSGSLNEQEDLRVTLVYAQTKGCGPCSLLETKVFPHVQSIMEQLVLVKLDFNDRSSRIKIGDIVNSPIEWARFYNLYATPGFALIDSKGKHIISHVGLLNPKALGLFLAYGSTGAYHHGSFTEYVRSFDKLNTARFDGIHSPIIQLTSTTYRVATKSSKASR